MALMAKGISARMILAKMIRFFIFLLLIVNINK